MHLTKKNLDERRKKRLEYMNLYEKKLRNHINELDSRRLGEMEDELNLQDIADFRFRTKEKLRKEGYDWTTPQKKNEKKSWWSWITGEVSLMIRIRSDHRFRSDMNSTTNKKSKN